MQTDIQVQEWCLPPVAIGDRIFFWENDGTAFKYREPKIAKVSGDQITEVRSERSTLTDEHKTEEPVATSKHSSHIMLLGQIYSGLSQDGYSEQSVARFDTKTSKYRTVAGIYRALKPRQNCAFAEVGDALYVIGGDNPYRRDYCIDSCLQFDVDTMNWITAGPLRLPRTRHGAFVMDNRIFVFGGRFERTHKDSLTAFMEIYNPELKTWAEYPFTNLDQRTFDCGRLQRSTCFPFNSRGASIVPEKLAH
ncbi:uncharacterized protein LOC129592906 [Paramacrobiotus metropolitanus]|uniref:uncharacterized protein LOC129592906 n=1 Tax=Paramacrobiotus metropolitanus TaxID=2943436 RepID=UPI0024460203|nr:uncharacterized protein LOC129592906 [Paramacrobiotus metropolitanus]